MTAPASSPRPDLRLVIGFLLTPVAAAVAAFAAFALPGAFGDLPIANPVGMAAGMGLIAGVFAVLVTVFCAVPALLWLLRRGPVSLGQVLGAGALLGNLPLAATSVLVLREQMAHGTPLRAANSPDALIRLIAAGTFVGIASAAVFWLIAIRGSRGGA